MGQFTVVQGKRYRAKLELSFAERLMASNESIVAKFVAGGFVNVQVVGSGSTRWVFGTWAKETAAGDLPKQVVEVEELP